MIVTYYPHSKNIHNLKDMEFEIFRTFKYIYIFIYLFLILLFFNYFLIF